MKTKLNPKKITLFLLLLGALGISYYLIGSRISLPEEALKNFIETKPIMGPFVFILYVTLGIIITPLSVIPFLPLASYIWGWAKLGLFVYIGWNIGSAIAFGLSRAFGRVIVGKFVDLDEVDRLTAKIFPKDSTKTFWRILIIRMISPVDIVSYVLGLTKIRRRDYFAATFIGTAVFAVLYSGAPRVLNHFFNPLFLTFVFLAVLLTFGLLLPNLRERLQKK